MDMGTIDRLKQLADDLRVSATVFVRDVGRGMLEISHNSLAAVGLLVVAVGIFFSSHGELRHDIEVRVYDWLQTRHAARTEPDGDLLADIREPDEVARATAASLSTLPRQQAAVAQWISRRYRVAPEPIARLVQEAWTIGQKAKLEPTLILAIMAIESSFNPFAQSSVGAQGLMQVMTRVHDDKYQPFGGNHAAFDPLTNLRVGVQVLKECIARAGSLEAGLRYYVGAANLPDDQGYAGRVLTEHAYLKSVAEGRSVAVNAPTYRPATPAPVAVIPVAASAPALVPDTRPAAPTITADEPPADGRVALLGL
jgi:hypothetical protein